MIKCPCVRGCPDRAAECRIECKAFKAYEAMKLEEYAERLRVRETDDAVCRNAERMARLKRRKQR